MQTPISALVTGSSSGIGAAIARRLVREGASVVIAARREHILMDLASDLRAGAVTGQSVIPIAADVSVRSDAERLVAETLRQLGRLDVLINNAGRGHFSTIEDTSDETLTRIFALNAFALWYTTRPALRHMRERGSGHIITIASLAGKLGFPFNSAYVAAKHAAVGFTHALRMELAGTSIHATVVCPGSVTTDWAKVTECSPMHPMLARAGSRAAEIARERGTTPPDIEGALPPERIAEQVVGIISNPVAELYTHRGTREFLIELAADRERAERRQIPAALAEQEVYRQLREGKGG